MTMQDFIGLFFTKEDKFIPSEHLNMGDEMLQLGKEILTEEELEEVGKLAMELTWPKKNRQHAIQTLQERIGTYPKRPIYYVYNYIENLPFHMTRDIMRYLGDYIDNLVKFTASEKLNSEKYKGRPLGQNIRSLMSVLPAELSNNLIQYNEIIYVPAKHYFKEPRGRKHLFTSIEVVLNIFITSKLSKELINLSKLARDYSENKLIEYYSDED